MNTNYDRETLIKKWLDNNLSPEELKAFEQLEDYQSLIQLQTALNAFKAPDFSVDAQFEALQPELQAKTARQNWLKPLLRAAAIIAICFSVYYYTTTLDTQVNTQIAKLSHIELPDQSVVVLNANSTLLYNERNWDDKREITLKGEAFFKVAKGETFDVITDQGTVSVLGTQFNVKQRENYFEATCFEGVVAVYTENDFAKLHQGEGIIILDGKMLADEKEIATQPSWLRGETHFKDMPLKHVLAELENYYDLDVIVDDADATRLFSGSITHRNLDLALQSITIPLNLSYSKSGTSIVLKRE